MVSYLAWLYCFFLFSNNLVMVCQCKWCTGDVNLLGSSEGCADRLHDLQIHLWIIKNDLIYKSCLREISEAITCLCPLINWIELASKSLRMQFICWSKQLDFEGVCEWLITGLWRCMWMELTSSMRLVLREITDAVVLHWLIKRWKFEVLY